MRLDAVGDVLMTTPALRAMKESAPERHLTLLASRAGAAAAALVPEVDDVLVHDVPWMKATAADAPAAHDRALVRRVRRERFDAAVIFTVYSQSPLPAALLCRLADVPLRLAHCRENPYQLLTDWVAEPEPERLVRHEVRRQLDLVASVGCATSDERLSLRVPPRAEQSALRRLAALGLEPRGRWLTIHPGATAPSRRYPPEGFAAVTRRLDAAGWTLLFVGTRSERALVDDIRRLAGVRAHSLAGETDLAELAALLSLSPLLIANNSGPVHVAAAVGTPVVDLYALTNPQHTPWSTPSRVLSADVPCKYCYRSVCPEGHNACLRSVDPEAIVVAVGELLDATATSGAAALH